MLSVLQLQGLINSVLVTSGVQRDPDRIAAARQSQFAGFGVVAALKYILGESGVPNANSLSNQRTGEIFFDALSGRTNCDPRMAMSVTTDDLTAFLSGAASEAALIGWRSAPTTFGNLARVLPVKDLRQTNVYKTSGCAEILPIAEGTPPKLSALTDAAEVISLSKYGRAIAISQEALGSDQIDLVSTLPFRLGQAIAQKQNDLFWRTLLTGNGPALVETGAAFFAAAGAYANQAAAGSALSAASLAAGYDAMFNYRRLSADGNAMAIRGVYPAFLCVNPVDAVTALELTAANYFNAGNAIGFQVRVIVEPLMSLAGPHAWMLASDPNSYEGSVIGVLNDRTEPKTLANIGGAGDIKGLTLDIEHFFTVAHVDWRGYWKNIGA